MDRAVADHLPATVLTGRGCARAGKDIMALYMEEGALKNIPLLSSLSRKFRQRRESRDSGAPIVPRTRK